jgi:hypothetical protein
VDTFFVILVRIFAVGFGLVLLLPGLCSIVFMAMSLSSLGSLISPIWILWLICFAISAAGIALIKSAFK